MLDGYNLVYVLEWQLAAAGWGMIVGGAAGHCAGALGCTGAPGHRQGAAGLGIGRRIVSE